MWFTRSLEFILVKCCAIFLQKINHGRGEVNFSSWRIPGVIWYFFNYIPLYKQKSCLIGAGWCISAETSELFIFSPPNFPPNAVFYRPIQVSVYCLYLYSDTPSAFADFVFPFLTSRENVYRHTRTICWSCHLPPVQSFMRMNSPTSNFRWLFYLTSRMTAHHLNSSDIWRSQVENLNAPKAHRFLIQQAFLQRPERCHLGIGVEG